MNGFHYILNPPRKNTEETVLAYDPIRLNYIVALAK